MNEKNGLAAFDPDVLLKTKEAVSALASSPLLPEHLRGRKRGGKFAEYDKDTKIANLLLVADAARAFRCNMLMLAKSSFVIGSSLDFDGRVYAALANTSGFLVADLDYEITGEKSNMQVVVVGKLKGESTSRRVPLHITTALANGMTEEWQRNPQQMLCYAGARQWVRRHLSKVLLGFCDVSPDELEPTETTQADTPEPASSTLVERLRVDMPTADYTAAMLRLGECQVQQQLTLEVNRCAGRNTMTDAEREKVVERARELWPTLPSRETLECHKADPAIVAEVLTEAMAELPEETGPSEAYMRIWKASNSVKNRAEIRLLSEKVEQTTMSDDEREKLLVILRAKLDGAEPDEPTPAYTRWERTIQTEVDAGKRDGYLEDIGSDAELTDQEAHDLEALIKAAEVTQ